MSVRETSLRSLVEKWLGLDLAAHTRVTRFGHAPSKPWRYVCVEATGRSSCLAFFFFRHDDGSWYVFPPDTRRPAMSLSRMDVNAKGTP